MTRWRDLSPKVRAVSIHESGHAVTGELLGWRVRSIEVHADGNGVCWFAGAAPNPWAEVATTVAAHGAELHFRGRVRNRGSVSDRVDVVELLVRAGLDEDDAPFAGAALERQVWPLWELDSVREAVVRVSRELARMRRLTRRMFIALAEPALTDETRRAVRRFCRRTVAGIIEGYLEVEV